jgi:uncharacterized protein YeaO (DUF488 family)
MIKLKRAYEDVEKSDGYRVLVDRLWPRGIAKKKLALDEWAKELSPSAELRKRFGHDPKKWPAFRTAYRRELRATEKRAAVRALAARARRSTVTLVYGARDEKRNNAVVLKSVLGR